MKKIIGTIISFRHRINFYVLCLIFSALFIFILVFLEIYYRNNNFRIKNIILRPTTQKCGKDLSKEIKSTRTFIEKYINAYQNAIEKGVNPKLRNSFSLANGKGTSIIAIFSTVSEACLIIYPSYQNELIIECTKYPVQMSLFSGLDKIDSGTYLSKPYEEALKDYNDYKGWRFGFGSSFSNLTFSLSFPKLLSFSNNTVITFNNVSIVVRGPNDVTVHKTDINHVGIITGENDFSFAIEKAGELAKDLVETQIRGLFITSDFFKNALLDEHLSIKAKEIKQKYSRSEKDAKYKYSSWEFKKDVVELEEEAKKYGKDVSYIEDLLRYPANQPKDGFLLCYYPNYFWFSLQWTLINIALLIGILMINLIERKNYKIAVLINKWGPKITIQAILFSINAWVFYERPKYLNIEYWIIPGMLLVACSLLTVLKSKVKDKT